MVVAVFLIVKVHFILFNKSKMSYSKPGYVLCYAGNIPIN